MIVPIVKKLSDNKERRVKKPQVKNKITPHRISKSDRPFLKNKKE